MSKFKQRFPDYEADWNYYYTELDDKSATVELDLKALDLEVREEMPVHVSIDFKFPTWGEDGEQTPLCQATNQLMWDFDRAFEGNCLCMHAAVIYFDDELHHHFYFEDQEGLGEAIKAWLDQHTKPLDLDYKLYYNESVSWETYDSIYPTDANFLQMHSRVSFVLLREQGDLSIAPRPLQFWAVFESEEDAIAAEQALSQRDYISLGIEQLAPRASLEDLKDEHADRVYTVCELDEVDECYLLRFLKVMSLESFAQFKDFIEELHEDIHGLYGDFLGWDCEVVRAPEDLLLDDSEGSEAEA